MNQKLVIARGEPRKIEARPSGRFDLIVPARLAADQHIGVDQEPHPISPRNIRLRVGAGLCPRLGSLQQPAANDHSAPAEAPHARPVPPAIDGSRHEGRSEITLHDAGPTDRRAEPTSSVCGDWNPSAPPIPLPRVRRPLCFARSYVTHRESEAACGSRIAPFAKPWTLREAVCNRRSLPPVSDFPSLPLAPGDYHAEWYIDDRVIPGHVRFEPMQPTEAELFDDIKERDPNARFWIGEESKVDRIAGSLRSGQDVVLTDVTLITWFPRRTTAMARHAVVGIGVGQVEGDAYERIRMQITGGDLLFGVAPIKATRWPANTEAHLQGLFGAEGNPGSTHEWGDHESGVSIKCSYEYSFSMGNSYHHEMRFAPVIAMTSPTPRTVDEWISAWVMPLLRVASLATRQPQRIAWITVEAGDPDAEGVERRHQPSGVVFGSGITQAPYQAEFPKEFREWETRPLFTLDSLPVPLQDLIVRWRGLESDKNPFLELYTQALMQNDLPQRARFLYLVQALEALHGHENQEADDQSQAVHMAKRTAALDDLAAVDADEAVVASPVRERLVSATRFIRKNLSKRQPDSLDRRIGALVKQLPESVRESLSTPEMATIEADLIEDGQTTLPNQFRVLRNWLSHGVKNYPPAEVRPWARSLETLCRAHSLRLLGFDEQAIVDGLVPPKRPESMTPDTYEEPSEDEPGAEGVVVTDPPA